MPSHTIKESENIESNPVNPLKSGQELGKQLVHDLSSGSGNDSSDRSEATDLSDVSIMFYQREGPTSMVN
jgi:hypothetical protein